MAESSDPDKLFYQGDLGQEAINEIQENGKTCKPQFKLIQPLDGFLSMDDLSNYKLKVYDGYTIELKNKNLKVCSLDLPSSGPLVGLYLNMLDSKTRLNPLVFLMGALLFIKIGIYLSTHSKKI